MPHAYDIMSVLDVYGDNILVLSSLSNVSF